MFRQIIVPVDGSTFAEHALPYAIGLARRSNALLQLVMVHGLPAAPELREEATRDATGSLAEAEQDYLEKLAARVTTQTGVPAGCVLLVGSTVKTLASYIDREQADLIVMSTHGRGGLQRAWLGSVADALVRQSRTPVLLVRPTDAPPLLDEIVFGHVLAAVDGSPIAEAALRLAASICAIEDARCDVLRVIVPPSTLISSYPPDTMRLNEQRLDERARESEGYLHSLTSSFRGLPIDTHTRTFVHYRPADAILAEADDIGADLIVLGSRGHGGVTRLLLGSVADKVIRGAKTPVLVCTNASTSARVVAAVPERDRVSVAG